MTRYEAYIDKDWEELGITNLLVARIRDNGATDFSVFLVDLFCLGVKDAVAETDTTEAALREVVKAKLGEENGVPFEPACAKKLIEGAVAYGEALGFAPPSSFRKARKVLSGLDASRCPQEFTYGRDGRPFYVRGSSDTPERVSRICAILKVHCGEDGYDYEDPGDEEADDPLAIRDDLQEWLEAEPEDVPRFYELSGLLTAMLICPTVLSPLKVMEVLWGKDGKIWADKRDAQEFAGLLLAYWNQVNDLITDALAPDAAPGSVLMDVWAEDFEGKQAGLGLTAATCEWTGGFLRATELWPEAWGDALTRPDLVPHWEVLGWWASLNQKENVERVLAQATAPTPRTLPASTLTLARALRPLGQPPA